MIASQTERFLELLARLTEADEVRTNDALALFDLQLLDSMKTVELMVALSSELGVEVSPAEFERDQWATPALFVSDVARRLTP
jgi:D-alanine--poly(phosphoribitol) ligase subunit 2